MWKSLAFLTQFLKHKPLWLWGDQVILDHMTQPEFSSFSIPPSLQHSIIPLLLLLLLLFGGKKWTQVTFKIIVFKIYNTRVWSEVQNINQNLHLHNYSASLVAQMVKNTPAMRETWAWSLGWEDALEKGMATHASILAWRILMERKAWQATVYGVAELDTTEQLSTHRGYSISETHLQGKISSDSVLNLWWIVLAPRKRHGFSNQTHCRMWVR